MFNRDSLRQRLSRAVGQVFSKAPWLAEQWGRSFDALNFAEVPFAPMRKHLRECRFALITTGGVHRADQAPYDMADPRGDPSYRALPADTPYERLGITHDYYDHGDARRDLNILLPMAHFRDLARRGLIGDLATCYSFMGHIEPPHLETLLKRTAPEVAGLLKQEQVDAVLLTPA